MTPKISFKRFLRENRRDKLVIVDLSFCLFPSYSNMGSLFESVKSKSSRTGRDFLFVFDNNKTVKLARKIFPKYGRNILYLNTKENFMDVFHEIYNNRQYRAIDLLFESELHGHLKEHNGNSSNEMQFFLFEQINTPVNKNDGTLIKRLKNRCIHSIKSNLIDEQIRIHEILKNESQIDEYMTRNVISPDLIVDSVNLYNEYRSIIGLRQVDKSEILQKPKIRMEPISEERESFISGNLFSLGDSVKIRGDLSNKEYIIEHIGPNYVSLRKKYSHKNKRKLIKKWINDVEPTK